MIDIDDVAASVMAGGSFTTTSRVESWRDGTLLAADVPVDSGTETDDVTLRVPESLSLVVPRSKDGMTWAPTADVDHPLACWGQRLRLYTYLSSPSLGLALVRRSWWYITNTVPQGDSVNVTASGLLGLIDEASFSSPVTATGTFGSMLRQLVEPAITLDLTNAPTDRSVPAGLVWDDNRLDAVTDLLTAWPAALYVDEDGIGNVVDPADTATSSLALTDGVGGTTMKWMGNVSRQGAANLVIARGYDSTGADVQGTAFDNDTSSPTWYQGAFSPLPVPFNYFSPLLTTVGQCGLAAQTVLARRRKQGGRVISADAVPYFALQTRDGVTVTSTDLDVDARFGIVDRLTMPVTAKDGAMNVSVRLVS